MSCLRFGYINAGVDPLSAIELGCLAEKYGFDTLWLPDHFVDLNGDRLEPWTVLSAIAVMTKKIKLASAVTDIQRTHPARTAHAVACLDVISRGRAVLGIGAGEAMNIIPFGLPWDAPPERTARLREAIMVIRTLWSSSREQTVSFSGHSYQLRNAFLSQPPQQKPHPPIYVGVFSSRRALRVVGELGDGWYSWLNTADTFKERWSVIRLTAESRGRSPDCIEPVSHLNVAFPRTSTEKKKALMSGKAALLVEKTILKRLGYAPQTEHYQNTLALSEDRIFELTRAASQLPDDLVYRTMAIGGPGEVEEKIDELQEAGVRHFAVIDLLGPGAARRTLRTFRKIIRNYQ